MSLFCQNCGAENLDEAKFCKDCGANLLEQSAHITMAEPSKKSIWSSWLLVVFPALWVIMDLIFTHKGVVIAETIGEALGAAMALSLFSLFITLIIFIMQKFRGLAYVNFVKDTVVAMIAMTILNIFVIINDNKEETASLEQTKSIEAATTPDSVPVEQTSSAIGIMYPIAPITVQLSSDNVPHYLKVEMNLEIENEAFTAELDSKMGILRDIIIRILSSKTLEDISTIKGKDKLKEQISVEMNSRLKAGQVKNIYFTDFIVQ